MNFLMVLNDMGWFWSHRLPLAKGILKDGYRLHLAAADCVRDPDIKNLGIVPHDLPPVARGLNPFAHIKIVRAIMRRIQTVKPDIIHAITIRYAFYTALANVCAGSYPAVYTIAGVGTLFSNQSAKGKLIRSILVPLLRLVFDRPNIRIIFQNHDDKKLMVDANIVKESQVTVIRGSGVDLKQFPYTRLPVTDTPIVLLPSRLIVEKGIHDFVDAARILKDNGVRARFQLAGGVEDNNPHAIQKAELDGWVSEGVIEYLGRRSDMPDVLKVASLVVLPSYYGEGVPKALLEAAAIGRPIVTTDMPGCREAVADGVNGVLVPPQNPDALALAIRHLLTDTVTMERYAEAGRARMEQDFHVDAVVAQTMGVYKSIK